MPQQCSNCNSRLSCTCEQRTASDGKKVCSNCLSSYEHALQQLKTASSTNNLQQTYPSNTSL